MIFDKHESARHIRDILASNPFPAEDVEVALVGTMFTHDEGNDYDYVVLVPDVARAEADFKESGYRYTGAESGDEDEFHTFRKGDVNIMLTESLSFFTQFKVAAQVTRYVQNLLGRFEADTPSGHAELSKEQRVKIHRIIMNEEEAE